MAGTEEELQSLAETINEWVKDVPGIPEVYLFGSRVRGDHRPDSDVDLRLFIREWSFNDRETAVWWSHQNETDFAELKAQLPGPLAIHRELTDAADAEILAEIASPVLRIGKVVCVRTTRPAGPVTQK